MEDTTTGTIEITIDDGNKLAWRTNMSIVEMNYWLDQTKLALLTGDAEQVEEA